MPDGLLRYACYAGRTENPETRLKGQIKVKTKRPKRKPGRPPKPIPKIDATPEEIARRIFANATPPDPSIRVRNRPS